MSEDKEAEEIAEALDDFERDVLRQACGDDRFIGWGAATGATCASLRSRGLLHRSASGDPYGSDLGRRVAAILRDRAIAAETKP